MALAGNCPQCGSRDVRLAHKRTVSEHLLSAFGWYPVRCKKCGTRFRTSIWRGSSMRYANCPRCYRSELGTWSPQYYDVAGWTAFKLRLGATPYRCEPCRCNFASFRACKERFSWRKRSGQAGRATQDVILKG